MNLTQRTTAALAWIDKELAICEALTDAPWQVKQIGEHSPTNIRVVSPIGVAIGGKEVTVGVAEILVHRTREEMKAGRASAEEHANAAFIATARTGYPAMLEGMKVAIESLNMIVEDYKFTKENNRDMTERGHVYPDTCRQSLDSILNQIEELSLTKL